MKFDEMVDIVSDAIVDAQDIDTGSMDYAKAAVKCFGWHSFEKEQPDAREVVLVTDGTHRWLDANIPELPGKSWLWMGHVGTHWHRLIDFDPSMT